MRFAPVLRPTNGGWRAGWGQRPWEGHTGPVDNLVRNVLEVAILVAVGGMLWQVVGKLRRGEIRVVRCAACGRPTSRAYPRCKHCGALQAEES